MTGLFSTLNEAYNNLFTSYSENISVHSASKSVTSNSTKKEDYSTEDGAEEHVYEAAGDVELAIIPREKTDSNNLLDTLDTNFDNNNIHTGDQRLPVTTDNDLDNIPPITDKDITANITNLFDRLCHHFFIDLSAGKLNKKSLYVDMISSHENVFIISEKHIYLQLLLDNQHQIPAHVFTASTDISRIGATFLYAVKKSCIDYIVDDLFRELIARDILKQKKLQPVSEDDSCSLDAWSLLTDSEKTENA